MPRLLRADDFQQPLADLFDAFGRFGLRAVAFGDVEHVDHLIQISADLGKADDPLLPIAMELEKIALEDDYFVERKLFPNVDFYSGIILQAMGIPTSMFTAIFALARTVGWAAQWNEMVEDPEQKIGRPRQLYAGATQRPFVPIEQRG